MNILQEMLNSVLADSDFDKYSDDLHAASGDIIPRIANKTAESILTRHLLPLFISTDLEAGTDFNREFRNAVVRSGDTVFEALTRMHARPCQVSSAILVLRRTGYAYDTLARWRTLHEISAMSSLISKHGKELAEKYLLHDTIQRYKIACQHQKYKEQLMRNQLRRRNLTVSSQNTTSS